MKLKKLLLVLLTAVSCICLGFAFGCKDDGGNQGQADKYTVVFARSEHVNYVIDGKEVEERSTQVDKNTQIKFSVAVEDGFLADTVVVKGNDQTLAATDGVYTFDVTSDVTFSATVTEDLLETDEDGNYLVSTVKDLYTVADMVNSGYLNYVTGSYILQNDIDCGGAKLDVIGHYENPSAFFSGTFDGKNHTISNFKIETNGSTYVGLFGCVQVSNMSDSVMILNLNVSNFEISATAADDANVSVGSLVGFSAGANVVACSAVNGIINVYGSGYFSYAGGAVGVQQSLTITAADNLLYHYHSSTEYVHTDVAISATGYVMAAGGVVGQSLTSHERAASMILNCYSEGSVYGAMRSGGIVGALDDYCSLANCYSKGYIYSMVKFPEQVEEEDVFAYAGGIAGYAGKETVISDSFTTCTVEALGDSVGTFTGEVVGGGPAATEFENGVTLYNVPTGDEVQPTSADFIKDTLKWNETDWVIVDGAYPMTNYDQGENAFNITLNYLDNKVKGEASKQIQISVKDDSYFPFSSYLDDEFDEYMTADAASVASYGFFFDEACTKRVPYGYVPTRDVTVYVGFSNYAEVAGTYEFVGKTGRTVKLILNDDATYKYVDVWSFDNLHYTYDGTKLIFKEGLFARLSDNVVVDEVAQPWLNYQPYTFVGTLSAGKLSVYDGTYFTSENLLVFNAASGQTETNGFVGTWERSASVNEKYTFNSDMTWSYSWKGNNLSGSYTVSGGVATLTGGISATAKIDASGLLFIEESGKNGKYYGLENSFYGNWRTEDSSAYLVLNGYGSGLAGTANAIVDGTVYDNLAYVKDGFFDDLTKNEYTYTLTNGYSLFGYFYYNVDTRTVTAMLFSESDETFIKFDFILLDYYLGEWIGEEDVNGEPFTLMDFNGMGLYKAKGDASLGYVVINGERVPYECNVADGLDGTFTYGGKTYTLTTNGDGTVTVSAEGASANLYRKDEMASTPLLGEDGTVYEFNGGGKLTKGGVMTATTVRGVKTEYVYKIESGSIGNLDLVISLYNGSDSAKVGSISIAQPKFVLKLDGEEDENLNLYLPFAGKTWAISALINSFYIGNFDLTYETTGNFNGTNNVPFTYFPEYNYIYVSYKYYDDNMSLVNVQIYLLILNEGNIAVSSYPYLVDGDYSYASPCDELYGKWVNTETKHTIAFDGLADSMFVTGIAMADDGTTYLYTRRFGNIYMWKADDESVAYTVEMVYDDITGENVYLKDGGTRYDTMRLDEVDVLNAPIFTARDGDNTVYAFNFDGTVKIGDKSGTYLLSEVEGDKTTVVITVDGKEITAVVDHSGTVTVID